MLNIEIDPIKPDPEKIKKISDLLSDGKIIAYPTDTIYGLGCDALNKKAIKRIYRIKRRKADKPLLVLVGNYKILEKYFFVSGKQRLFLKAVWPGPITVILEKRNNLPKELNSGQTSLAVRMPKNEFLLKLLKRFKNPIVSTSLNKSGQEPIFTLNNIDKYFGRTAPDFMIDAGKCRRKKPSKLVDLRDVDDIKILRY
jgi:tRNA threonylcarbamoyl adenosine modification protein (Sua5/YciO/YrdC/YwlC family)